MSQSTIIKSLKEAELVLSQFLASPKNIDSIEFAGNLLAQSFKNGNKVITCGNGGSMCDAIHFAEELSGKFRNDRKSLPAISISDAAHITCVGNDYGFDKIFSRFIEGIGKNGDVLVAISTSGNSTNVINAIHAAKAKGMQVIGLTGKDGGKMATLCDVEIRAPHSNFADRAQEIHIKVIHCLIEYVESKL